MVVAHGAAALALGAAISVAEYLYVVCSSVLRWLRVFADPYTGEVRGALTTSGQWMPLRAWFDALHRNVHLGAVAATTVSWRRAGCGLSRWQVWRCGADIGARPESCGVSQCRTDKGPQTHAVLAWRGGNMDRCRHTGPGHE